MKSWIVVFVLALLAGGGQWGYLIRNGKAADIAVSSVFIVLGTVLYLMVLFNAPIPTLTHLIEWATGPFYRPIARWVLRGAPHG